VILKNLTLNGNDYIIMAKNFIKQLNPLEEYVETFLGKYNVALSFYSLSK
jgi:hypothetical protein